jgi:hypothetical protein
MRTYSDFRALLRTGIVGRPPQNHFYNRYFVDKTFGSMSLTELWSFFSKFHESVIKVLVPRLGKVCSSFEERFKLFQQAIKNGTSQMKKKPLIGLLEPVFLNAHVKSTDIWDKAQPVMKGYKCINNEVQIKLMRILDHRAKLLNEPHLPFISISGDDIPDPRNPKELLDCIEKVLNYQERLMVMLFDGRNATLLELHQLKPMLKHRQQLTTNLILLLNHLMVNVPP